MPDITLYELGPTRSARVRWALQEAGLVFESVQAGIDIFKREDLKAIHPLSKVPAVMIDDQPLFESGAIVTAIADLVPQKKLIAKPGTWARNLHYQWMCFALSEMEPFLQSTEINTIDFILPKEKHVPQIIAQNNAMVQKAARALEAHLAENEYLVENQFSVTDIFMAYTLNWGQEQKLLDGLPNIHAYTERLYDRPHCTLKRH